ncbi:hypothetical protein BKA69DRAFT_1128760 [Paraphysoderma sedebokerense]|nr:hypothetical protein BKA69DRAFT_1128760 [Paraphysoderma sedebokerense]
MSYYQIYVLVFKAALVYLADLTTAIMIGAWDSWSTVTPKEVAKEYKPTDFWFIFIRQLRWFYVGSITISFLLLGHDMKKALKIIKSRDISFAFTSVIAYRFYTLRSYAHYCFFRQINNRRKFSDRVALFVFFTLKGWKRLLFAEAPRQAINCLLLYSQFKNLIKRSHGGLRNEFQFQLLLDEVMKQKDRAKFGMFMMLFVFLMWAVNVLMVVFAITVYIPLLCKIRGNLKEYCCHMIDKRIDELVKKKALKRVLKQQGQIQNDPFTCRAQLPALDPELDRSLEEVEGHFAKACRRERLHSHSSTIFSNGSPGNSMYRPMSGNYSPRSARSRYSTLSHNSIYNSNIPQYSLTMCEYGIASSQLRPSSTYCWTTSNLHSSATSSYRSSRIISSPPPFNFARLTIIIPGPQQSSRQPISERLPTSPDRRLHPPFLSECNDTLSPTETDRTSFSNTSNVRDEDTEGRKS